MTRGDLLKMNSQRAKINDSRAEVHEIEKETQRFNESKIDLL